jgi:hypothetical protein
MENVPFIPPTLPKLNELRLECAVNGSLRQRFIEDPKAVLEERGIEVPEGVTIEIAQEAIDTHIITLPPFIGNDLSDKSLLHAIGGLGTDCTWCTLCTATSLICAGSLGSLVSLNDVAPRTVIPKDVPAPEPELAGAASSR